jgi:hypothetical protein
MTHARLFQDGWSDSVAWRVGWVLLGGVIGLAWMQQLRLLAWTCRLQFNPRHWVRFEGAYYTITDHAIEAAAWCRDGCRGAWVIVPPPYQGRRAGIAICYFNRRSDAAMFMLWQH